MPPIRRHKVSEWTNKQTKTKQNKTKSICYLQETHFRLKDTSRFKVRGWITIYHANGHHKKAGVASLISDKLDFKPKTIIREEEGH